MIVKTKNDIETIIKSFMTKQFLFEFNDKDITVKTDLFKSGLVDSYGFVELVSFIESEFQIKISNEELVSGSMNSVSGMVDMIDEKLKNVCK